MIRIKSIIKRTINKNFPKKDYLNNGERYDPNIAEHYDQCHISRYDFALKYLSKQDKVIDIACGTGWGTEILSKNCRSITGVDISRDAIKFAKKKYSNDNSKFILSDFFDFSQKADAIISFETLEHLSASSFEEILHKLLSLTNNIIIGSVPYEEIPGNNPYHVSFLLNELNFDFLKARGKLIFFYQDSKGAIYNSKEAAKPQNLIFLFHKAY